MQRYRSLGAVMSRVGKKPIEIPAGVEAKLEIGKITLKGPLGQISQDIHPKMAIKKEDNNVNCCEKTRNFQNIRWIRKKHWFI